MVPKKIRVKRSLVDGDDARQGVAGELTIPSRADWGDIEADDIEAQSARDSFFGKTFAEAEAMFERNALYYQEELQSLPRAPFNFYAGALVSYLLSEGARGDADGGSSFLHMVLWMLQSHRGIVAEVTEKLLVDAACQVAQRQVFYGASKDIYGSFSDIYEQIMRLVERGN